MMSHDDWSCMTAEMLRENNETVRVWLIKLMAPVVFDE